MLLSCVLESKRSLRTVYIGNNTSVNYYMNGNFSVNLYNEQILSFKNKNLTIGKKIVNSYFHSKTSIKRINKFLPEEFTLNKVKNSLVLTTPFGKVNFTHYIKIDIQKGIVKDKI